MQRYFVKQRAKDNRFAIEEEDRHHICKVMRMAAGDEILIINQLFVE